MTKKCIYCKKTPNPTVSRSFHRFPKNDQERAKKWISALHLTNVPNLNTSYICSDHFKEQDFSETGEQRRRLRPAAIPCCKSSVEVQIVSTTPNSKCDTPPVAVLMNNTYNNHEINSSLNRETDVVDSNQSDQVTFSDVQNEECLLNNDVSSDGAPRSVYNEVPLVSSSHNAGLNKDTTQKSINHKRKRQFEDKNASERIRISDGKRTNFFSRQDFSSQSAWHKFMWYVTINRRGKATALRNIIRKKKKLNNLKEAIVSLKEQDEFTAAQYLQVSIYISYVIIYDPEFSR